MRPPALNSDSHGALENSPRRKRLGYLTPRPPSSTDGIRIVVSSVFFNGNPFRSNRSYRASHVSIRHRFVSLLRATSVSEPTTRPFHRTSAFTGEAVCLSSQPRTVPFVCRLPSRFLSGDRSPSDGERRPGNRLSGFIRTFPVVLAFSGITTGHIGREYDSRATYFRRYPSDFYGPFGPQAR